MATQSTTARPARTPRADYSRVDQTRATAHCQGSMPGMARIHVINANEFATVDGMARRTVYKLNKRGVWTWIERGAHGFRMAGTVGNPARLLSTLARRTA